MMGRRWVQDHAAVSGTSKEGKSTLLYLLDRPSCRCERHQQRCKSTLLYLLDRSGNL